MLQIYNDFCVYLVKKKKSSDNTLASYQRDLKAFFVFLRLKKIDEFDKIDYNFINAYVKQLKKEGKSPATISRNLSSLRCFFKYLVSKKIITFNPMLGIKNDKKQSAELPETLTAKEVATLLSSPDCSTEKGIRDKAMLEVMYATGIRVSELLTLKLADISLDIGYIIIAKGTSKERLIPLYPLAVEAVSDYINNVRGALVSKNTDVLFLNTTGVEMTRQGFWKIIKAYAKEAKISADITPKILRHSFATHLLENGADIHLLKDMLGHSDISSTMIYAKVLKNKYLSAYENCHPRAKIV